MFKKHVLRIKNLDVCVLQEKFISRILSKEGDSMRHLHWTREMNDHILTGHKQSSRNLDCGEKHKKPYSPEITCQCKVNLRLTYV